MSIEDRYLKLVEVLEHEVTVYRHLLELVRKEKDILISPEVEELNASNEAKEAMVTKLKLLERNREKVSRELAETLGLEEEPPRLQEIAAKLGFERGDKLRTIQTTLQTLIKRIKTLNQQNEALVQSALSSIHGAMDAIKENLAEKPTYEKKGKMDQKPGSGRFVSKSV